jgi:hypothetical protein
MASNGDIPDNSTFPNEKKRRNIPRREWAKREIRRLIIDEGLTNRAICEKLDLPARTVERYLHEIYSQDNQVLIRPSAEDLAVQINIFKEQLAKQRQDVMSIATNQEVEPTERIMAHELCANISWVISKLSYETPAAIARSVKLDGATSLGYEQKGLNLVLRQ